MAANRACRPSLRSPTLASACIVLSVSVATTTVRRMDLWRGSPLTQRLGNRLLTLLAHRPPDLGTLEPLSDQGLRRDHRRGLPGGIAQPCQPLVFHRQQGHQQNRWLHHY